VEHICPIMVG